MHAIIRPVARVAWSRPSVCAVTTPAWKRFAAHPPRPACGTCSFGQVRSSLPRGFATDRKRDESQPGGIKESEAEGSTIELGPPPRATEETSSTAPNQDSMRDQAPHSSQSSAESSSPSPSTGSSAESSSPKSRPAFDLPSSLEKRRSELQERFSRTMDHLQTRLLTAGKTLNDVTGYSSIETIKNANAQLELDLTAAHERVRAARQAYKTSNTKRAATQREVTTLLARKDAWSPTDLERFTELYRTDHVLEGEVASATAALTEAEADEQSLNQRLNAGILKRYHEEQIWSDRIRRASTWGTWGLMGMNFLLFVVLQFVAEPWKRKRLVKGVVEEEKGVLEEVRRELASVKEALLAREESLEPAVAEGPIAAAETAEDAPPVPQGGVDEVVVGDISVVEGEDIEPQVDITDSPVTWQEYLSNPGHWRASAEDAKALAKDLASERVVQLTMREASILALEGAAAGVALAVAVGMLLVRG